MIAKQKHKERSPVALDWPRFQWKYVVLLTPISFVLALIALFVPEVSTWIPSLYSRVLLIVGICICLMIISALPWFIQTTYITFARVSRYSPLFQYAMSVRQALEDLRESLFDILRATPGVRPFEISKAIADRDTFHIVVNKQKGKYLKLGDMLAVVHAEDGLVMGIFEVTELRSKEYYAVASKNIDAVWLGHVKQQSTVTVFPNMFALYIPQGDVNGD